MTDSTYHNPALDALRRQVTGRVLSGEAQPIAEVTDQGERVTFTTTGATGTVLERFTRDGLGDLSGEWATVAFDDGETIEVLASALAPAHAGDCVCPVHRCGGCGYNERTGCNCLV